MPGYEPAMKRANRILPGQVDVLFTNPPFGTDIPVTGPVLDLFREDESGVEKDRSIAYSWGRNKDGSLRRGKPALSVPPERLFVQKCVEWVKPGGRIGIVLPNGILSNPGPDDEAVRRVHPRRVLGDGQRRTARGTVRGGRRRQHPHHAAVPAEEDRPGEVRGAAARPRRLPRLHGRRRRSASTGAAMCCGCGTRAVSTCGTSTGRTTRSSSRTSSCRAGSSDGRRSGTTISSTGGTAPTTTTGRTSSTSTRSS
ncbi:SAM-dependent methyltransferase [Streptomyces tricolor]|nr:SAM-dependent methyltransferase [Streptomyces tricolor]